MIARVRGFTLIELLVALTLLSLGLLGAWSLLVSSLRGQVDARHHAAATGLVRDMAERIRANPAAGAAYAFDGRDVEAIDCDSPEPCDAAQRAAADLDQFIRSTRALLPGNASATIEFEPAIGPAAADRYVITLHWQGSRDENAVALQLLAPPVAG